MVFWRMSPFPVTELWLMDIDAERLEWWAALPSAWWRPRAALQSGAHHRPAPGVQGATYVTTQLRVGMMPARRADEYLGRRHDLIGQETTGVGGMGKALRTIPVMLKIAEDMRAAGAWGAAGQFHQPLRAGHPGASQATRPMCQRSGCAMLPITPRWICWPGWSRPGQVIDARPTRAEYTGA